MASAQLRARKRRYSPITTSRLVEVPSGAECSSSLAAAPHRQQRSMVMSDAEDAAPARAETGSVLAQGQGWGTIKTGAIYIARRAAPGLRTHKVPAGGRPLAA